MTDQKIDPYTVRKCIEVLPKPGFGIHLGPYFECRRSLEALLPDPAEELVAEWEKANTVTGVGPIWREAALAFARWIIATDRISDLHGWTTRPAKHG